MAREERTRRRVLRALGGTAAGGALLTNATDPARAIFHEASTFGIATNEEAVLVGGPEKIRKLNPQSGEVVKTFPVPTPSQGWHATEGLAWDGTNLWYIPFGNTLYELDTGGNVITKQTLELPLSSGAGGLTWDGNSIWVTTAFEGLYQVDPESYSIIDSVVFDDEPPESNLRNLRGLAWDGDQLWAVSHNTDYIIRMKRTGEVTEEIEIPIAFPGGAAWDGEYLWVGESESSLFKDPKIYQINTNTGDVVQSLRVLPLPLLEVGGVIASIIAGIALLKSGYSIPELPFFGGPANNESVSRLDKPAFTDHSRKIDHFLSSKPDGEHQKRSQESEQRERLRETLTEAETHLQKAIAAPTSDKVVITRERYRQARNAYDDALEHLDDAGDEILDVSLSVSPDPEIESPPENISRLPSIHPTAEDVLDEMELDTLSAIRNANHRTIATLRHHDAIGQHLGVRLTALNQWYAGNEIEFTEREDIERRRELAEEGYQTHQ